MIGRGPIVRIWKLIIWLLPPLLVAAAVIAWFQFDGGSRSQSQLAIDAPRDQFERRVRDYLLDHPEVIMEAVSRLEARQRTEEETAGQKILTERAEEIFRDPDSPVVGNPDGDVTLVEFFDYNCPYCRQMAPLMVQAEAADPKLRIVYKEFPILGPNSVFAAKAALAARKQGKYGEFHKALMQTRGVTDEARTLAVAAQVGLDSERLKVDMQDAAIRDFIDRNMALAQALHINGTPGFVVGHRILTGATDLKSLQAAIQEAREKR
jgi:protein-disulfide isomerase